MVFDWHRFCRAPGFQIDGDEVLVRFDNGRSHRVRVRESNDAYEFRAIVVRAGAIAADRNLPVRLWERNRLAMMVGVAIDDEDRISARGWIPKVGVDAESFRWTIHRVAAEGDRLEFLLTGRDSE